MSANELQRKMHMTITQVSVHKDGSSPVFGGVSVRLDDEGGGQFLTINDQDGVTIKLDFDEFDSVVKAVDLLRGQGTVE